MAQAQGRKLKRTKHTQQTNQLSAPVRDIIGILIATVATVILFSLFVGTQALVTKGFKDALEFCFGVCAQLLAYALYVLSFTFFTNNQRIRFSRVCVGLVLIFLSLLASVTLICIEPYATRDFVLSSEVFVHQGGICGAGIGWILYEYVGKVVGLALMCSTILIGAVICGLPLSTLLNALVASLHDLSEHVFLSVQRHPSVFEDNHFGMSADSPHVASSRAQRSQDVDEMKTTFLGARKTTVLERAPRVASAVTTSDTKSPAEEPQARKTELLTRNVITPAASHASHDEHTVGDTPKPSFFSKLMPFHAQGDKTLEQKSAERVQNDKETADTPTDDIPEFLRTPHLSSSTQHVQPHMGQKVAKNIHDDTCETSPVSKSSRGMIAPTSRTTKAAATTQTHDAKPASVAHTKQPAVTRPGDSDSDYKLPSLSMLNSNPKSAQSASSTQDLENTMERLQGTLLEFGLHSTVVDYVSGPLVTTFRVEMGEGERVNKIRNLEDDIALTLAAEKVRIFAPIPGTSYVGIEIPNAVRQNVCLGDVLPFATGGPLQVAVGRDSSGKPVITDISKMPHMLVAGTTGSGKSVMINSMIMSLLMRTTPKQVRLIMVDPKRVEFSAYNGLPHLYVPVVTEPRQAASALQWAVSEMERRLKLFERAGARNILSYNKMVKQGKFDDEEKTVDPLPYLVVIIDELSDLMMVAGKDVEASIVRIAQLARAAGIHLVVATQRPSANVVTGLIKSNIDSRVALKVSSGIDSRVILDETGAERLLGNGDMLFKDRGLEPKRVLGCYTSDAEINSVVDFIREQAEPDYHEEILSQVIPSQLNASGSGQDRSDDDPLIWEAAQIVVDSQQGATSNLQRRLSVGYARAGRIMDMLEAKGIVGPPNGSKPRDVLMNKDQLEEFKTQEAAYKEV